MSVRIFSYILAVFALVAGTATATAITSDFNTGLEGWGFNNNASLVWQGTGGVLNSGFLEEDDNGNGNMNVSAPGAFLLDLSSGTFTVSFALKALDAAVSPIAAFGTINFISTANGTLTTDVVTVLPSTWTTYTLPITAAAFGNDPNFGAIMSDLNAITLVLEYDKDSLGGVTTERAGLDDFTISSALANDAPVPEPGTLTLLAAGGGLIAFALKRRAV